MKSSNPKTTCSKCGKRKVRFVLGRRTSAKGNPPQPVQPRTHYCRNCAAQEREV